MQDLFFRLNCGMSEIPTWYWHAKCFSGTLTVHFSTTTEEEGAETKEDEVILCDGCNAEVHLRCLNLTAVRAYASGGWWYFSALCRFMRLLTY